MKALGLLLLCVIGAAVAEKARFDNYRVYRLNIDNAEQLNVLQQVENYPDGYSFWQSPTNIGMHLDLLVPPHKFSDFEELTTRYNIGNTLNIKNFQEVIDNEQPAVRSRADMSWDQYYTISEIYAWLDSVAAENPGVASTFSVGTSHEGNDIRGLKISYKAGNPVVVVESNIHAREWITSATTTWIINQFITSSDPAIRDLAENIDWHFIPITNPDGFVYSHSTNRNWRKTRYLHGTCYGADPNRNFDFAWMQGGASSNPCSDTFAGPEPFSEVETRSLSNYVTSLGAVEAYLAFHSYGQYLLTPFGYTTETSDNHADLMQIATAATNKLAERFGTVYTYGSTASVLYIASGVGVDWAKGALNIPLTYTYEFRDKGTFGFVLPASQIVPNAEEVLDSLIALVSEGRTLGYF